MASLPLVFGALLCAGLATGSSRARAADWPEFMGPTRDQVSTETGLIDAFPASGPRLVWERPLGKGYSAPSVRGDVLVAHHRVEDQEIVEACSPATGATLWKYGYPSFYRDPFGYNNGPRCTPLLTKDRCYTMGAEGVLACCDLATGRLLWKRDTGADFNVPEAFFGAGSSPVLEDGLLFVQIGGQPNSGVVAFDARTGKTVWQNVGEQSWTGVPMTAWPGERLVKWNPSDPAFQKQASYCTPVLATIHGRRTLLVCTRQGLVSLDPKTGRGEFLLLVSRAPGFHGHCHDAGGAGRPDFHFIGLLQNGLGRPAGQAGRKRRGRSLARPATRNPLDAPGAHRRISLRIQRAQRTRRRFRCVEMATGF
jgi:outer membrane protein assembly factor BamB